MLIGLNNNESKLILGPFEVNLTTYIYTNPQTLHTNTLRLKHVQENLVKAKKSFAALLMSVKYSQKLQYLCRPFSPQTVTRVRTVLYIGSLFYLTNILSLPAAIPQRLQACADCIKFCMTSGATRRNQTILVRPNNTPASLLCDSHSGHYVGTYILNMTSSSLVELNYYTKHCTYIKFIKFYTLKH